MKIQYCHIVLRRYSRYRSLTLETNTESEDSCPGLVSGLCEVKELILADYKNVVYLPQSLVVIVVAFPMLKRGSHSKEMHERNSSCISMIVVKILMMILFKLL